MRELLRDFGALRILDLGAAKGLYFPAQDQSPRAHAGLAAGCDETLGGARLLPKLKQLCLSFWYALAIGGAPNSLRVVRGVLGVCWALTTVVVRVWLVCVCVCVCVCVRVCVCVCVCARARC